MAKNGASATRSYLGKRRRKHLSDRVSVASAPSGPELLRVGPFSDHSQTLLSSLTDITYSSSQSVVSSRASPLRYKNLTINPGVTLTPSGSHCVFIHADKVTIAGTIDVSGSSATSAAEPPGVPSTAEVTEITVEASGAEFLSDFQGGWFSLNPDHDSDPSSVWDYWFNVDGLGAYAGGNPQNIEIAINSSDSASDIAFAIFSALAGSGDLVDNVVTHINPSSGDVPGATLGGGSSSVISVTTLSEGVDGTPDGPTVTRAGSGGSGGGAAAGLSEDLNPGGVGGSGGDGGAALDGVYGDKGLPGTGTGSIYNTGYTYPTGGDGTTDIDSIYNPGTSAGGLGGNGFGGGGAGGDSSAGSESGYGGAGGGGLAVIVCRELVFSGTSRLLAKGGDAVATTNFGSAGGGGSILVMTQKKASSPTEATALGGFWYTDGLPIDNYGETGTTQLYEIEANLSLTDHTDVWTDTWDNT